MPPQLFYPIETLDLDTFMFPIKEVRKCNRQRYEMEQINGILYYDEESGIGVGLKNVRDDEFWVRGHIPGRPLLPGVLMCECAAQVCSFVFARKIGVDNFLGFLGMEGVKFRGQVVPGDRLVMIARCAELRPRRTRFETQGVVSGKLVFEGDILGIPM